MMKVDLSHSDMQSEENSRNKRSRGCLWKSCCLGLIIELLFGGLILAILTTFWLTSVSQKATNNADSTPSTLIINGTTNNCTGNPTYTTELVYLNLSSTLP